MPTRKILFIDDDPGVLKAAELLLCKAGYEFRAASNPTEAYSLLAVEAVDAILLDLNFSRAQMSGEEGLTCLREILRHDPNAVVLVVTGHSGLTVAVQALRGGAKNFIMKPWSNERLLDVIEEALTERGNASVQTQTAAEAVAHLDGGLIVGECDAILRIKELVEKYARLTAAVLVMGENGTGKSLVAQALHRQSGRSKLIVIDAANLAMSDLADIADTTVVLEDVDRLDPGLTTSLTAWLQMAGGRNTRVVATTCRSHPDIGLQRSLLYALSTLEMTIPALWDRGNDIELLANHFARVFALRQGFNMRSLTPDAIAALKGTTWSDNLHALRRVVERAVVAADGFAVTAADLDLPTANARDSGDRALDLERTEKYIIQQALGRHNFNVSKAAIELGLTRQTLYRRMARHGL